LNLLIYVDNWFAGQHRRIAGGKAMANGFCAMEKSRMACIKVETKVVMLRLPYDVKAWIEKESARTMASQNSEVIRLIRARMDAEERERVAG
jgi:hypothetical protein